MPFRRLGERWPSLGRRGLGSGVGDGASLPASVLYAVEFDATTTLVIGSEASLDDLADGAMTAEGYYKITASAAGLQKAFMDKAGLIAGTVGWGFGYQTVRWNANIACLTTPASSTVNGTPHDSTWHHIAMTFDDAGDRKIRLWFDGAEMAYASQTAGVGAVKSAAAQNAGIGTAYDGTNKLTGRIGWQRISNVVRYTVPFIPAGRDAPPANDANTVRLFKMDEGTGTTITDSSTNAQNGTLANGTWVADPL